MGKSDGQNTEGTRQPSDDRTLETHQNPASTDDGHMKQIENTSESQIEKGRPKIDELDLKTSISTTVSERRKQQFEDIVKLSDMSVAEALRRGMDLIEDEIVKRRMRLKRLENALGVDWYWRV